MIQHQNIIIQSLRIKYGIIPQKLALKIATIYITDRYFRRVINHFLILQIQKDLILTKLKGNCKKTLSLGISILSRNPVDLTTLLHVCNCINEKNYPDTTNFFEPRFKNLLDAIFSTGDGKTMKSAIRIVNMEDDYILKGVLGFLGGKESLGFENNRAYSIWEKKRQKLYFEDVMNDN
jgi:hypothetical protein